MARAPAALPDLPPAQAEGSDIENIVSSLIASATPDPDAEEGHKPADPQDSREDEDAEDNGDLDPSEDDEGEIDGEDEGDDDLDDEPQDDDDEDEEVADGEDEDEDDEEVVVVDADDDEIHEVKVNGQLQQVTLDELKRNYSGVQAIDAELQKAREATKAIQAQEGQIKQREHNADQLSAVAYQIIMQDAADPGPEHWEALLKTDEAEWTKQRAMQAAKVERANARASQLVQAMNAKKAETDQAAQAQKQHHDAEQSTILQKAYPVFGNEKEGAEHFTKLAEFAMERYADYGLTPEILAGLDMALPVIMLNEIYDMVEQGKAKPKPTAKKGGKKKAANRRRIKRTVRPGGGTAVSPKVQDKKRRQRLRERAEQSGHPNDVAALMIQRNE